MIMIIVIIIGIPASMSSMLFVQTVTTDNSTQGLSAESWQDNNIVKGCFCKAWFSYDGYSRRSTATHR